MPIEKKRKIESQLFDEVFKEYKIGIDCVEPLLE
jgi:hypothetical protein